MSTSEPGMTGWQAVPGRGRRRAGRPAPRPLGDVLAGMAGRRGWQERLRSARIHDVWAQAVGPDVARHATPVRLVGGVLLVAVADALWATQLTYLAPQIVVQANRALGEDLVAEITFRVSQH